MTIGVYRHCKERSSPEYLSTFFISFFSFYNGKYYFCNKKLIQRAIEQIKTTMNLFSHIEIPKPLIDISFQDRIMLFGSCFAENLGNRFIENKFQVDVNPFGILYNPESIALSMKRLIDNRIWKSDELFFHEGLYHSFGHHSSFSDISKGGCLQKINERFSLSADNLQQTNRLLITFGTAYGYLLKETGHLIANCHKLPAKLFVRKRLSIQQMVEKWEELLAGLFEINKEIIVCFTVSPVRYWQDGVHENQLSKSILLLAIEQLQTRFPERIVYFPAYELLMDELRDYRFYAEDLFHPSDTAIHYIWERFVDTYMNEQTQQFMKEVNHIQKALTHRPLNTQNESYKQFISQTLLKINLLNEKMPYICFQKETEELKTHL
jgi:hypothetical protein